MNLDELLKQVLGPFGALVILAVITYYLMVALAKSHDARFKLLEEQARQCSESRVQMRTELVGLQTEVRELYKAMLRSKQSGDTIGDFVNKHDQKS